MHNPFHHSNARGGAQSTDPTRLNYIPPPPPPLTPGGGQVPSHAYPIPPPPPRPMIFSQSGGQLTNIPPPPPAPAPSSANPNNMAAWSAWQRQLNYVPPAPPAPPTAPDQVPYNPSAYSHYQHESVPMTWATYTPSAGNSFGPGVGIPGLVSNQDLNTGYDRAPRLNAPPDQARETYEAITSQDLAHVRDLEMMVPPHSPNEFSSQWTKDRVLAWLSANSFSDEWLDTFDFLNIHGTQFLEIGKGHGGKGNYGMIHSVILPQLARECKKTQSGWDQAREQNEVKRLRKLIRHIVDTGTPPPRTGIVRHSSKHLQAKNTDAPPLAASPAEGGEMSPGLAPPEGTSPVAPLFTPVSRRASNTLEARAAEQTRSAITESILRNVGGSIARRHSPRGSKDAFGAASKSSQENSPQPSPALAQKNIAPTSNPTGQRYVQHQRNVSSTSIAVPTHQQHQSTDSVNENRPPSESRRYGQEGFRAPTVDQTSRVSSSDGPQSAKERRGFLQRFRNRKAPSPDEHAPSSPSSPINGNRLPPSRDFDGSDWHILDKDTTSISASETIISWPTESPPKSSSKYIMLTPDGWNYRLLDVTAVESFETFQSLVCYNIGLPDARDMKFFPTAPGQMQHNEPLSELALSQLLARADAAASLKIMIHTPHTVSMTSATSGAFPQSAVSQPHSARADEVTLSKLTGTSSRDENNPQPNEALDETPALSRSKTDAPHDADAARRANIAHIAKHHANKLNQQKQMLRSPIENHSGNGPIRGGTVDFDKRRRSPYETEGLKPLRKAPPVPPDSSTLIKANSLSRKPQTNGNRTSWPDRPEGSRLRKSGEGLSITIDSSRNSRRRAIADSPSGSFGLADEIAAAAVVTANSTANSAKEITSTSSSSPEGTRTDSESSRSAKQPRALESIGFGRTASGRNSPNSPRSPGEITFSKGNVPFKVPDYNQEVAPTPAARNRPAPIITDANSPAVKKVKEEDLKQPMASPNISPSSARPPRPQFIRRTTTHKDRARIQFEEPQVSFSRPPAEAAEVDEDSDDGLFQVPLANQSKGKSSVPAENHVERPSLTLVTKKAGHVSFNPDIQESHAPSVSDDLSSMSRDRSAGDSAGPSSRTPDSPEDYRKRRASFIKDTWAPRPTAEDLVENLDDFFPQVDLDQPLAPEDEQSSPPASPLLVKEQRPQTQKSTDNLRGTVSLPSVREGNGLEPGEFGLKRGGTVATLIAQRQFRKAGGVGRTKSIRDTVKETYRHPSHGTLVNSTRMNSLRSSGELGRRKTKMFGARIEQIKPPRGSRLLHFEPPVQETGPQRQVTFKWVKGQLIGKGSFGRVYLGVNTTTGELLAVKQVEVNPQKFGNDKEKMREMVRSLDQEIDTMQHLDHDNIVQYLGCERKEYSISIFLEYISGGSIGSCLRAHGKFEEPVVSSLTRQTLSGLAYLHHEGILHRDLKADNILLDTDGTCKISDFGISKKTDNIYGNDASNSMQGTVFWMAPEVVRSHGQGYSAKVDIWSLGCVVLEMFSGKRPWAKDEIVGVVYKLGTENQAPPIPDDVSNTISPAALSFMWDCFNIDPADRPTADTLLRAPFAFHDDKYNFYDTTLYDKIKPASERHGYQGVGAF